MNVVPYKESNNYVLFLLIQFLKLKTPSSYTALIININKNFISFEKNITDLRKKMPCSRINVVSVIIPSSANEIKNYSFAFMNNLKKITIPNTITKIKDMAFYSCYSLNNVIIPASVIEIETGAFHRCESLKNVLSCYAKA